MEMDVAFCITL